MCICVYCGDANSRLQSGGDWYLPCLSAKLKGIGAGCPLGPGADTGRLPSRQGGATLMHAWRLAMGTRKAGGAGRNITRGCNGLDRDARTTVLCHCMGACVISASVLFQLGVLALDLGRETLGDLVAVLAGIVIYVLLAGWRSYDLTVGRISDMGIVFAGYQRGQTVAARVAIRILAALAIAQALTDGLPGFALPVLVAALAVPRTDSVIVALSAVAAGEAETDGHGGQAGDVGDLGADAVMRGPSNQTIGEEGDGPHDGNHNGNLRE